MRLAITHSVSPHLPQGEVTFISRQPVDYQLAVRQHDDYCAAVEKSGVRVIKLSHNLRYPDCCFVEDTAIVVDELAIITTMGVDSRRQEPLAVAAALRAYRELAWIKLPATIEGGDVLRMGKKLFVGLSKRTNPAAVDELKTILHDFGYQIVPVHTNHSLHLKTACSAIDAETLLINPRWLDTGIFAGYRLISVPEGEDWGANCLRAGTQLFLQQGFARTAELVQNYCAQVQYLNISEFNKVEAGLTCLSIIFDG